MATGPAPRGGVDELLDRAPCGYLSFAESGTVERVNRTLLDMLQLDREDVVGRHVEQILTVASRIFYQTHWFPLLRMHGSAEEIFLLLRPRSGEDVGALVNAVRRERPEGAAYDCVFMRVRERRKYEDELLRAKRAAEQARAETEAREKALELANEQLEAQAAELEMQQQMLEEQAATLEIASTDLEAINADLRARTGEAEQLRELAEEANRAKSTFLAVMSHELRTPLNAIAGYVQIMEMGIHGPVTEAQRDSLTRIHHSQQHLLRLIDDVLNLSRIEAGRVEYASERVPVAELLAEVTPMVEPQFARRRLAFAAEMPPELVARLDREKGVQILLNLLGNAVKFTPEGGAIRVHGAPDPDRPDRLVIRVADTGIGIPPDKLESIFAPFVQVDDSRTRSVEGSGLGLAISRDLARGMGGDLSAESTPGHGSTFIWSVPRADPTDRSAPIPRPR